MGIGSSGRLSAGLVVSTALFGEPGAARVRRLLADSEGALFRQCGRVRQEIRQVAAGGGGHGSW